MEGEAHWRLLGSNMSFLGGEERRASRLSLCVCVCVYVSEREGERMGMYIHMCL